MSKIELIKNAIEDAKNDKSKLTNVILELPSFSSAKIKHLLNNLGAISKNYLEIGLHKSGTFIAALKDNNVRGVGIDNWVQFEQDGVSKKLAYELTGQHLPNNQYQIIEQDCFTVERISNYNGEQIKFDMFNYDGNHSFEFQRDGIKYFYPMMEDEFILCVDDTSWKDPKEGTEAGIKEMGLKVLFEEFLWDNIESGQWHNGFSVFLLKK